MESGTNGARRTTPIAPSMISANERIVKRPMSDAACLSPWIHMTARDMRSTGEGCVRKGLVPVTYWRKPEFDSGLGGASPAWSQ